MKEFTIQVTQEHIDELHRTLDMQAYIHSDDDRGPVMQEIMLRLDDKKELTN